MVFVLLAFALSACAPAAEASTPTSQPVLAVPTVEPQPSQTPLPTNTPVPFELSSPGFEAGGVIPREFACNGTNLSSELVWGDPPAGTQSLALVFEDPGPGWVHWVIYNIPGDARGLRGGIQPGLEVASGGTHGVNSWGRMDYGGPCPPEGSTHNYVFALYALDTILDLEPGANKRVLLATIEGHVLAEVELSASFAR